MKLEKDAPSMSARSDVFQVRDNRGEREYLLVLRKKVVRW